MMQNFGRIILNVLEGHTPCTVLAPCPPLSKWGSRRLSNSLPSFYWLTSLLPAYGSIGRQAGGQESRIT